MKKVFIVFLALFLCSVLNAEEKKGFLTSKWCAQNGLFADCRLESFACGSGECYKDWNFGNKEIDDLVLYVHDEGKIYNVVLNGIKRYKLDDAVDRNDVTIIGQLDGDTLYAKDFKAPPPPKKSFFKGCL
jgi:hypothetical protein